MSTWSQSDVLTDKKSKFQARAIPITSADDIPNLIDSLIDSDKSFQKATHKAMYAWRIGSKDSKGKVIPTNQGMSDCGESGAGSRLMTLLERSQLINVLVIVTRWYGGTPLGSARFRHISSVASDALHNGGFFNNDGKETKVINEKNSKRKTK